MVNYRCIVVSSLIALFSFGCVQKGERSRELMQPIVLENNISQFFIQAYDSQEAQILLQQANSLLDNHYYDEAVNLYNQLLIIEKDNIEAWNNRGNALAALKLYKQSIASYDKAIRLQVHQHHAWYNRGNVLAQIERYSEAIYSYEQALRIKPNKYEAWINRGVALSKLQRYQEAIDSYDEAITLAPHTTEAYYNKACVHALQSNISLALKHLKKVIDKAPDRYKQLAQNDPDFEIIRGDKRFQDLIY